MAAPAMAAAAAAGAGEMFTRGQPGDADNRGESLVQLHMDRMQQQKETAAMDKLRQLMPQLGDMVRALALSKNEWDIDKAVSMLRSFQVAHLDKVNALNKKRKKLREAIEGCTGSDGEQPDAQQPSGSSSDSGDRGRAKKKAGSGSGSSGSDSGSEGEAAAKKLKRSSSSRKDKESSRSKASKKKKSSSSRSKSKKRSSKRRDSSSKRASKDKDRGRERRKRKAADSGSGSGSGSDDEGGRRQEGRKVPRQEDLGRYGFIRESDFAAKNAEFMLWVTDAKGGNVETLGRLEEKELFKEFMEDYNTGTLPHRKYYNLEAYEREAAAKARSKAAGGGDKAAAAAAAAAFDARADEEEMRRMRHEARLKFNQDRLAEAYNLLKHTDRAKDMRDQELLRAEMTLAYKTGDRARAQKLFDRLQPDDQKK